jgi:hypothetical protein
MFRCSNCSKEFPFESALLSQDLAANTVGLCSPACQNTWYEATFGANAPSSRPLQSANLLAEFDV